MSYATMTGLIGVPGSARRNLYLYVISDKKTSRRMAIHHSGGL